MLQYTPDGVLNVVLDASGDGLGNTLGYPSGWHNSLGIDADGNIYATGHSSDNAFLLEGVGVGSADPH